MSALNDLLLYKEAKDKQNDSKSYAIPGAVGVVGLGVAAHGANENRKMLDVLVNNKQKEVRGKLTPKGKDMVIKELVGDASNKTSRETNPNAAKYFKNKMLTRGGLLTGALGLGYGAYKYNKNKDYDR